jgi:ABC-type sugar transport system substrate-binding protein
MKRRLGLVLFVLVLLISCSRQESNVNATGAAKTDGFVIGLSAANTGNTWTAQYIEDWEMHTEYYKSKGLISRAIAASTDGDMTEQINQCLTMINNGIDALLVWPVSPTSLQSVVDAAEAKGTMVLITNDPAAYENTFAVIGDNDAFQRIQAVWLAEKLGGKGNIVQITGTPGFSSDILRQEAAADVFSKYPNIKTLASAPGNWNTTDAQAATATFLATYDNIDAIFSQDVMAEGILKAFENARITPKLMTGDYTHGFFKKWAAIPELDSIGVTYQAGIIVNSLDVAIRLLQGKKIKDSALSPNPLDESLKNAIYVDPAYVVTREGDPNAPWMKGYEGSKAVTLDNVLKMLEGRPDGYGLDGWLSEEQIDAMFE